VCFLYINWLILLFYNRYNRYLTDYFELAEHKIDKLLIKSRVTTRRKTLWKCRTYEVRDNKCRRMECWIFSNARVNTEVETLRRCNWITPRWLRKSHRQDYCSKECVVPCLVWFHTVVIKTVSRSAPRWVI